MLYPLGVAARRLGISTERLRQLANAGRVKVTKDSLGRRFVNGRELGRLIRERTDREGRRADNLVPA